jgi:hypothetical protein
MFMGVREEVTHGEATMIQRGERRIKRGRRW